MEPADFYSGIVADAYAKLKSTSFDAGPYAEFVKKHGAPALEIGCGDGEPMLELCAAGLDVDGVDSSIDMVERCRENAQRRGLAARVFQQRVEALDLTRRYASVYFAGPTFNLLPDDETGGRALQAIRKHLTDDGVVMIPLWVPGRTPASALTVAKVAYDEAGTELRYTPLSETFDNDRRTRVTTTRYERITPDGAELSDREWIIHWHSPQSFRTLCDQTGLRILSILDDETGNDASELSTSFTARVTTTV